MVDSKENYKFDLGVKELNSLCQRLLGNSVEKNTYCR